MTQTGSPADFQKTLFREAAPLVGAGFKPALLQLTPIARYSLGRPPTAVDCSRRTHECDLTLSRCEPRLLHQGGFETRPLREQLTPVVTGDAHVEDRARR